MTKLEEMLKQMEDKQVVVLEDRRLPRSVKGLYLWDEKQPLIILRPDMDGREKLCVLQAMDYYQHTAPQELARLKRFAYRHSIP